MTSKLTRLGVLAVLMLAALSCGQAELRGQPVSGLDRKLSTFEYIEEGDLVTFIVSTKATRYRDETPYIPFEIAIANKGLKRLQLTRESFTLIDEQGNRYPAATPRELIGNYDFLDFDRRLENIYSVTFNKFASMTRYPSNFAPERSGGSLVRDVVQLPRFGYLIDFIYFPRPETGVLEKRFELFVESPDLPDPVFVRFLVK